MSTRSIAVRMNALHERILTARAKYEATVLSHALRIGALLLKARERAAPGEFLAWCEANCDFSYSAGKRYAGVARLRARGIKVDSLQSAYPASRRRRKARQR
jgi:hypothetical protein